MSAPLRALVCGLALAGLSALAAATAPRASPRPAPMALDRNHIALGESLQLRLTRALKPGLPALESLDLAPLQRDFEVLERTLGRDGAQETLTLTLYPRRSGRFDLPTLGLPGRALRVTVSEGSERVSRVQWQLSVDPPEPLLRQSATLTLEACDDGSLLWKRPALPSVEGLLLRPLYETEIITTRDGQRCTAHRWHWALLPTASGSYTLPLPVLEAGKFGARLRFAVPALDLRVQPLPAWLPPEAAVGRPELSAEPLPAQAAIAEPLAWRLRVTGGYSAAALQRLLAAQLHTADPRLDLERYAPQIEAQTGEGAAPVHRVTLYLVPRERAVLELPALQLPWYDPSSGLLQQQGLPAAHLEVVDPQRQRLLRVALGIAAVLVALALGGWLWPGLAWRFWRRQVLRRVQRAPDVEALGAALLAFGPRRGAAPAATLREWQQRMAPHGDAQALAALVQALEQARFGADGVAPDEAALRQRALVCLRRARRVPRA